MATRKRDELYDAVPDIEGGPGYNSGSRTDGEIPGESGSKNRVMDKWARPSVPEFAKGEGGDKTGVHPAPNQITSAVETAAQLGGGGYGGGEGEPAGPAGPSPEDDAAAIRARSAALQQLIGSMPDRVPFSYAEAPKYVSNWQDQINQMANEILGRQLFSYNALEDPFYHQYRESYTRGGQQAMRDTMGQAAGLTGGYGSTYAQGVGQQTYNRYMQDLADKVPELEQLAYDRWLNEGNQMQQRMNMLQNLENIDYGRYADKLGQWNADRNFDYGKYADDRDWAYRAERDRVADARYLDSLAYDRARDRAATMAAYGDFSDLEAMGYTPTQIAMLRAAYEAQQNGGGGYGYGGDSSTDNPSTLASVLAEIAGQRGTPGLTRQQAQAAFGKTGSAEGKGKAGLSANGGGSGRSARSQVGDALMDMANSGSYTDKEISTALAEAPISDAEKEEIERELGLKGGDRWR